MIYLNRDGKKFGQVEQQHIGYATVDGSKVAYFIVPGNQPVVIGEVKEDPCPKLDGRRGDYTLYAKSVDAHLTQMVLDIVTQPRKDQEERK